MYLFTYKNITLVLMLIIYIFSLYSLVQKKVIYGLMGELAFFAAVVAVALLAFHGTKQRSLFVGILCDIFNIIMYTSPLTIMVIVS